MNTNRDAMLVVADDCEHSVGGDDMRDWSTAEEACWAISNGGGREVSVGSEREFRE